MKYGYPYVVGEKGPELFVPWASGIIHANPKPSTLWPWASGIIHANPRLYDQYVGLPYANSPAGSLLPVLSNIATQAIMSRRKLSTLDLWPRWYNYGSHGVRMNRDGKVGYLSASQEGDDLKIELVIVGAGGARNARRFYYDTAGKEMLRF